MKKLFESEKEIYFLNNQKPVLASQLQQQFNLTPLTSNILSSRDGASLEFVKSYLFPSLSGIPDPFLFHDMEKCVSRIYDAIIQNENILIYGDYDVDGITATTIIINFFKSLSYLSVRYYIPDRFSDGYGLNLDRILQLYKSTPFRLLITVDCGISNAEEINVLTKHNIDVIVTDHHLGRHPPSQALSVLNPSMPGSGFPFPYLSGVGVTFFLLLALRRHLRDKGFWNVSRPEPNLGKYLDMVALGSIADMVPLIGLNRILVAFGLKVMMNTANTGLKLFLESLDLSDRPLSTQDVAFRIAPRLNAAGRLENASKGVSLFTTQDKIHALALLKELENLNTLRQKIVRHFLEEAHQKISQNEGFISPFVIILWDSMWHEGVMGIVASRLVEIYNRSVMLISLKGNEGKGSARGVTGLNVYKAFESCISSLVAFGGHPMAGGIRVKADKIIEFSENFSSALEKQSQGKSLKTEIYVDALVKKGDLSNKFFDELQNLKPFGVGNPPPLLGFWGYKLKAAKLLKGKHVKLSLFSKGGFEVQGIAFNSQEWFKKLKPTTPFFAVPTLNHWNGRSTPQLIVKRFIKNIEGYPC